MMPKWSRDYWPSLILAGLIMILALAGLVEWAWLHPLDRPNLSRSDNRPASDAASVSGAEQPAFELPDLESFAATVERPLFAENRRPPAEEELEAASNAVSTPLTLKLMGVIFTPRQHSVLMQDAKGKYKRMRRNDTLDGWTLVTIAGDRVTLQQGSEQKELMLLKPRPKPPVAGQATPHAKPKVQDGSEDMDTDEETDSSDETTTEDTSSDEEPEASD